MRRTTQYLLVLLVGLFTCLSSDLHAQSLAWDPNPEPDIAGYRVLWGTASGNYTTQVTVGKVTTYQPQGIDWSRRMYFAVKAFNTSGLESPLSNEAVWTPPSVTTVTALTSSSAYPLVAGTAVTWTATASNNLGPVEYRFWMYRKTAWVLAQDYGPSNTLTWTAQGADAGTPYSLQVWVRPVGSTAAYEAWRSTPTFDVLPYPLTLSSNVDFPTPTGNEVTWTATLGSPSSVPVEYRFLAKTESATTWTVFREYATSNRAHWTAPAAGRYMIQAWSRPVGSTATSEFTATTLPFDVGSSALTLTAFSTERTSPAFTGTRVTWTARVRGGTSGPVQYQFWMYSAATGWRNVQPYGPSETFTWTPTWGDEGDYYLQVWARSNGSTAAYDHWRSTTSAFQVQTAPIHLTTPTLFPSAPSTFVTWTAGVPSTTANMEYQFWIFSNATSQWSLGQAYGTSKTFSWTPGAAGTYAIQVRARQVGSTAAFDVSRTSDSLEISAGPAFNLALTSDVTLPVATGTPVTWSAAASGGAGPLEYQFRRQDGSNWIVVQAYSSQNRYTWTPSSTDAGQHQVQVRVRTVGSSATFEDQMTSGVFTILP